MYTFIKLTAPPPSMMIFDASNRDQCEVKRLVTNTPLQALVMLNDPQYLEASRVLAAKLLENKMSEDQRLEYAFRLIVCRYPKDEEKEVMNEFLKERLSSITKDQAEELLKVGEYPASNYADKVRLAAYMQLVSMLYNLDETIVKS